MDEPCAVHYVGILQTRDTSIPTAAQVYNYTGLNGLSSDFNGTINVTQAGIPFSSGQDTPLVTPAKMYAWHISLVAHHKLESHSCFFRDNPLQSRLLQTAPAQLIASVLSVMLVRDLQTLANSASAVLIFQMQHGNSSNYHP